MTRQQTPSTGMGHDAHRHATISPSFMMTVRLRCAKRFARTESHTFLTRPRLALRAVSILATSPNIAYYWFGSEGVAKMRLLIVIAACAVAATQVGCTAEMRARVAAAQKEPCWASLQPNGQPLVLTRAECEQKAREMAQQAAVAANTTMQQRPPPKPYNWKRVEADNGAAYVIDLNSISHGYTFGNVEGASKTADATICIVQNDVCDIMNQRRWTFYCPQNQIVEMTDAGFTPAQYVPPQSIGRRILDIACSKQIPR